ncbi:T9SS type A sorting domain-containing protein [Hymenobacter sp. ASUV-10]|uniref:T9SS type A sorting domain-containing protein n=1 Tax=Hymenobacter aranciens TaxID=3063996 RepID=A0ABT9B623_9BACT|nr:T9SS type A sorting domain-containing protein [Hymenobacter sp. ASUV-10]
MSAFNGPSQPAPAGYQMYRAGRSINVTPAVGEGDRVVVARFYSRYCSETYSPGNPLVSLPRQIQFVREPTLTVSNVPATVRCGNRTAFTPSVSASQAVAVSYAYSVGTGWTTGSVKNGPIMVTPSGTNGTTLTITPTYNCGGTSVPGTPKAVAIGFDATQPVPTLVTIPELCPGQRKIIVATQVPGASSYTWSGVSAPLTLTQNNPTDWFAYITAPANLTTSVRPVVRVTANSAYGCAATYSEAPVKAGYGNSYLDIYPAPVNVQGVPTVCANSVLTYRLLESQAIGTNTELEWTAYNCTILTDLTYGAPPVIQVQAPSYNPGQNGFWVKLRYKDGCGEYRLPYPVNGTWQPTIFAGNSINGQPCSAGPDNPRPTAYPSPANESLTLKNLRGTAELYNAQGRVVRQQQLPAVGPATLDIRALPAGLYYLKGMDATGQAVRQTVQVQH